MSCRFRVGSRHATVASRDGTWLYSVYLNLHHGPFIHALNLNDAFAFCIFLPPQSKDDWKKQRFWAIMMSEDGALYAVNGALGIVAEVDLSQVNIRRSTTLPTSLVTNPSRHRTHLAVHNPQATEMAMGGAALSPDGKTLWAVGATGLLAINTDDFSRRGQYLEDWIIDSIVISEDGNRLYAVDMERNTLLQIDAVSGTITGELPGVYGAVHLLRIETQR